MISFYPVLLFWRHLFQNFFILMSAGCRTIVASFGDVICILGFFYLLIGGRIFKSYPIRFMALCFIVCVCSNIRFLMKLEWFASLLWLKSTLTSTFVETHMLLTLCNYSAVYHAQPLLPVCLIILILVYNQCSSTHFQKNLADAQKGFLVGFSSVCASILSISRNFGRNLFGLR